MKHADCRISAKTICINIFISLFSKIFIPIVKIKNRKTGGNAYIFFNGRH